MPCRSDYMEPNARERYSVDTAQLLEYVLKAQRLTVSPWVRDIARSEYGDHTRNDQLTSILCYHLKNIERFEPSEANRIIYDGRNPMARRVADWWEKHKKVDQGREEVLEKTLENLKSELESLFKLYKDLVPIKELKNVMKKY